MSKFESDAHTQLHGLCHSAELRKALHPYPFIQGVIFAVCSAPEIPMPETWLPWIIKTKNQLANEQQADRLTDLLMTLFKYQLKDMSDEKIQLSMGVSFDGDTSTDSNLSQWCQGMLFAHSQLEPVWQNAWGQMKVTDQEQMRQLQKDLSHCLYMLSTFADIPLALRQAEVRGNDQLSNLLPKIFLSFQQSLITYVGLSGRLVDFLPNQFETFKE